MLVALPDVRPAAVPVTLVMTPEAGVPKSGVTKAGDVANTKAPVPVSFETAPASERDVMPPVASV